jgi:predicted small metal-binding protein
LQALPRVAGEVVEKNVLHCECGFEVRADDEAELIAQVQRHALEAHGMRFSPEEVLRLASGVELRDATSHRKLRKE